CGLCNAQLVEIVLDLGGNQPFPKNKGVIDVFQADFLTAGIYLMTSVLFIPLGQGSGHVHFLDYIAPTDAGVVSAERDLAFLCRGLNYALLSSPEVVVEQILEPHSSN